MKIKIMNTPVNHIVIENFLNKEELYKCMDELEMMEDGFYEGEFYSYDIGRHVNHKVKKCLNLDPYTYYGEMKKESYLLNHVLKKFWTNDMRELYDSFGHDSVFSYLNHTDFDLLSSVSFFLIIFLQFSTRTLH